MRCLMAFLLIAALIPGTTVLCLSPTGHVAFENRLGPCCGLFTVPARTQGLAISQQANQSCANCTDAPILAVRELEVRVVQGNNQQAVFVPPVEPKAPPNALGVFDENLRAQALAFPANPSASNPLRC